jgi:hypothetical protein
MFDKGRFYDKKSKFWEGMTHRQIADFQMCEERLCMPFSIFQEAVEKTLNLITIVCMVNLKI